MKRSKYKYAFGALLLAYMFGGCDLELQRPYDYDDSAGVSNQIDMDPWEFIVANKSYFTRFLAAVEYAEIDAEEFNQPGLTIFPLTNQAIANNPATGTGTNRFPGGYWYRYPVNKIKPSSWDAYPKEQVRQFVLNHIMKYAVSYDEIIANSKGEKMFYPTKATNGYGYISLHMLGYDEVDHGAGPNITYIWVNDFPSHYTKDNPSTSGYNMYICPRTCNIRARNGSYIHIMEYFLDFPTDEDFLVVPIYNP